VTNLKAPLGDVPDRFHIRKKYHETADYVEMLRILNMIGCQYPITLEDDALATENWVHSVSLAKQQLESSDNQRLWLGVKLFVARKEYPKLASFGVNNYFQDFNLVAILLNKDHLTRLADYLEFNLSETFRKKNIYIFGPKDVAINNYARDSGLSILSFEPVVFQHTGIFSSVVHRTPDEESVNEWYLSSNYFQAEGKPITFNPKTFQEF